MSLLAIERRESDRRAGRADAPMTIRAALRMAKIILPADETSDLDAQLLLAFVLGVERVYLLAHSDQPLVNEQLSHFQSLLERRAAGEPIAYITGRKWFYDLDFCVASAVLIPRPETELLLEEALRLTAGTKHGIAVDIGTGSGALAVSFARQRPAFRTFASDIDAGALRLARKNARCHAASVEFLQGDLAVPLLERGIRVDLLMANLPYIASDELENLAVSRYEPKIALDGGPDGLNNFRRLLPQIPHVCRDGARLLLEIGADQGPALTRLVEAELGLPCEVLPDYAGHDRILRFQLPRE